MLHNAFVMQLFLLSDYKDRPVSDLERGDLFIFGLAEFSLIRVRYILRI